MAVMLVAAVVLSALAWYLSTRPPAPVLQGWKIPSEGEIASETGSAHRLETVQPPGPATASEPEAKRAVSEQAFGLYAGWSEARKAAGGALVVDIEGAVAIPGVYVLPAASRVWDALHAAGGAAGGADTLELNLARPLEDGELLYVPRRGEAPPPEVGSHAGAGPGMASGDGPGGRTPARVDLNHASARQLETLPGIGPALSARIVAERSAHGAFKSLEDLAARVSGIGPKSIERLKPFVLVR